MIEWESTAGGIRVVDAIDNEVSIQISNWTALPLTEELPRPTDAELVIETDELTVPSLGLGVIDLETGVALTDPGVGSGYSLSDGPYLAIINSEVHIYIRIDGPGRIERDSDNHETRLEFPEPGQVHLGFRSFVRAPGATVTVPRTTEGVATAISATSASHRTISPDRTFWTMRRHPPAIEFGDTYDIPDDIESSIPETGIELRLPETLDALFMAAPLAYYLAARITFHDEAGARLLAPAAGVDHDLGPHLVESIPDILARVFWLDCIARNGGPHAEPELVEHDLLTEVGIEHEVAYEATPAERLAMYLDAPYDLVADDFPDWPLAMHVDPVMEHVSTLPYLLNHLSFIYPPETAALAGSELMERSLDDFYRGPPGPIAHVEMMKPKLRRGQIHGWLAEGTPIDVFKTLPEAYENHRAYLEKETPDEMSVVVVLNDRDMTGEHDRVAEIYQERASDSRLNVQLEEELTRQELADLFAESHEFLHYIGHCEVDGLRCADGNLPMSSLQRTNVQTFFLNACGSYYEGLDLVRKGAIAGAVTFRKVLDEPAAKVGTAFAHLLMSGFPIETALRLARRRIMMGKDYAVVGNGMQTISMKDEPQTGVVYVDTNDSGDVDVSWDPHVTWDLGSYYRITLGEGFLPRLGGNRTEFTLRPAELAKFIEGEDLPVILDGEFHWSHEIVDQFRAETD